MLTRDLLLFRAREGKIRPAFVPVDRADLTELARSLVAVATDGVGRNRDEIDEALAAVAMAFPRPKVSRGLAKLLLDRMTFEEPRDEVAAGRLEAFKTAASVLRALPDDASIDAYQEGLSAALTMPLARAREDLYADLPGQRPLLEWRRITAKGLLERYNMALAQGLILYASRLVIEVESPELLRVRRLLRWLKFCRLVTRVSRGDDGWTLEVEGPAAILEMQKKYGLQLASFLPAVPVLRRWRLEAEIRLPRREPLQLSLDQTAPLVSPRSESLGHVPPEVARVAKQFEDGVWKLDLSPGPRPVGATDLCVPDLRFRHQSRDLTVDFELFHRWHRTALERRLAALRSRPDPFLFLGVERALLRGADAPPDTADSDQIMVFNTFPSERKIREILARVEERIG